LETVEHENPTLPAVIEEEGAATTITQKPKVVVKVMYIISAPHTKKPNIFSNHSTHSTSAKEATATSSGIRNLQQIADIKTDVCKVAVCHSIQCKFQLEKPKACRGRRRRQQATTCTNRSF
jgi:hypothetical protein